MASPDDAATDQLRNLADVKVALVAGVCIIVLMFSLEYGADIEALFVYRLSPLAPYFAYVFSRDAALSVRTWVALAAVVTLGTLGFFML